MKGTGTLDVSLRGLNYGCAEVRNGLELNPVLQLSGILQSSVSREAEKFLPFLLRDLQRVKPLLKAETLPSARVKFELYFSHVG